jgi:hypothetical protein
MTKDSINYFLDAPTGLLARPDTLVVLTTAQLQRLAMGAGSTSAFTSDMDLLRTVEWLHDFSAGCTPHFILKHLDTLFVASCGQVSTTPIAPGLEPWRVRTAAHAATWWLQNPDKPFESITTSVIT